MISLGVCCAADPSCQAEDGVCLLQTKSNAKLGLQSSDVGNTKRAWECEKGAQCLMLLRHGHTVDNMHLRDPALTKVGIKQALSATKRVGRFEAPELIVVSPMRRTMQTAMIVFRDDILSKKVPVVISPDVREFLPNLAPFASQIGVLGVPTANWTRQYMCENHCDSFEAFSKLQPHFGFTSEETKKAWDRSELTLESGWKNVMDVRGRLDHFQQWLSKRPEKRIAVVGHFGVFHIMLGWPMSRPYPHTRFEFMDAQKIAENKKDHLVREAVRSNKAAAEGILDYVRNKFEEVYDYFDHHYPVELAATKRIAGHIGKMMEKHPPMLTPM